MFFFFFFVYTSTTVYTCISPVYPFTGFPYETKFHTVMIFCCVMCISSNVIALCCKPLDCKPQKIFDEIHATFYLKKVKCPFQVCIKAEENYFNNVTNKNLLL